MKKLSFIAAFFLISCAQAPTYSPQQMAQSDARNLCIQQRLTGNKLNKCIADKYAQLLPAYVQQSTIEQQDFQNSLSNFANSFKQPQGIYCNTTTTTTGAFSSCH